MGSGLPSLLFTTTCTSTDLFLNICNGFEPVSVTSTATLFLVPATHVGLQLLMVQIAAPEAPDLSQLSHFIEETPTPPSAQN